MVDSSGAAALADIHFDPRRMLAFDLETTGQDPHTCRIVTSAMVRLADGSKDATLLLADPGVEIPEEATKVHGISTEYARENGEDHAAVVQKTIQGLKQAWSEGLTVIAYNATYDLTVMLAQDPSFTIDGLVLDPFVIDQHFDQFRKGKRTLEMTCEHYQVRLDSAHDATEDALAAARLAWVMAKKWPELTSMSGEELMEQQAIWYYERRQQLYEYFKTQGKEVSDFNFSWPMQLPG